MNAMCGECSADQRYGNRAAHLVTLKNIHLYRNSQVSPIALMPPPPSLRSFRNITGSTVCNFQSPLRIVETKEFVKVPEDKFKMGANYVTE